LTIGQDRGAVPRSSTITTLERLA